MAKTIITLIFCLTAPGGAGAEDWPQWRGPQRDGVSTEKNWLANWPATGPAKLWSARIGDGFSAVTVAGGRVYAIGNRESKDTVYCFDAKTGRILWQYAYPCAAIQADWTATEAGPRATPCVWENQVYTISHEGQALCLDARTGKVLWDKKLIDGQGQGKSQWGVSGSPLIEGGRVIYNVGGAGTALDPITGALIWKSQGTPGYASPLAYTRDGHREVTICSESSVIGLDPKNGQEFWRYRFTTIVEPIFLEGGMLISSFYPQNAGSCAYLRFDTGKPTVGWQNRNMRNHLNGSVVLNGFLYGNDQNTLKCLDLKTGEEKWSHRGIGKGGLIAAGDKLLVLTERGELIAVAAAPEEYKELARAKVLEGVCWTQPVLSDGLLYCRSHEGVLVCLDLRPKKR